MWSAALCGIGLYFERIESSNYVGPAIKEVTARGSAHRDGKPFQSSHPIAHYKAHHNFKFAGTVQVGDVVTHIDGTPVAEWSMPQVRAACIGTAGTSVRLTIIKPDGRGLDVTLVMWLACVRASLMRASQEKGSERLVKTCDGIHGHVTRCLLTFVTHAFPSGARQPWILALPRSRAGKSSDPHSCLFVNLHMLRKSGANVHGFLTHTQWFFVHNGSFAAEYKEFCLSQSLVLLLVDSAKRKSLPPSSWSWTFFGEESTAHIFLTLTVTLRYPFVTILVSECISVRVTRDKYTKYCA